MLKTEFLVNPRTLSEVRREWPLQSRAPPKHHL